MTATRVLITGATGHVGGALLTRLRDDPAFDVVALTRRATAPTDGDVQWVHGDLAAPADVTRAARGCDAVFLVWPFGDASAAPPVLDALTGGVGHVVHLSTAAVRDDLGPAGDPITAFHTAIERGLAERDVRTTALRSGGMASNALGWADQVRAGDDVRWVFGALARPLVHEADLADVAVLALQDDPRVAGTAPRLTGPAAVTQADQVAVIGNALGRPLHWVEVAPGEVHAQLIAGGWPAASADGALAAWATMAAAGEPVHDTARLTGRPGRTFAQWARDHVADFR